MFFLEAVLTLRATYKYLAEPLRTHHPWGVLAFTVGRFSVTFKVALTPQDRICEAREKPAVSACMGQLS
jgi:hypothetical protein